ncbi:bifunctional metallophosphatase/5'-nucleotidase [Halobacteriales archaeon QS_8_69_26]|nr:MAG: bifunctional metallophosphatase/5'-nucleotidase [Halobacteriales archaeon QS_8_69_26]
MIRLLHYADIENVYDDPERAGRLAGLIGDLRDSDTLVCGAGDNTSPGVLTLKGDAFAALPFFRAVDPDVDTLGNHEFDRQVSSLRDLLAESPQTWVCANARDGDGRFGAEEGVVPWTVLEADGDRVGVFGVASPETDDISPQAADLTFTDPVPAARDAVAALRDRGVDHVVGLSHAGEDDPLARALDVPVILGGHVHEHRTEYVDGTLLLRPGSGGHRLSEVTVDDDAASARWHAVADADPDPAVVEEYRDRMAALGLDETVAVLDGPVERVAYRGESAVGNFVADAIREAAGAGVGLMHGASIREDDPLRGEVTVADVVSLVPFDNDALAVEVPGDRLRRALRDASAHHLGGHHRDRWYGQVSNARILWDHDAVELVEARVGDEPLDPDRTYTVGMLDYVLRRGGLFRSLDPDLPHERVDGVHDVLVDHARRAGIPTEADGRIERVNLPTDA